MQLNPYQKKLIADIDRKVNAFVERGVPHEYIKINLINTLPHVKEMVLTVENKQIDLYLNAYQGFRRYVRSLMLG